MRRRRRRRRRMTRWEGGHMDGRRFTVSNENGITARGPRKRKRKRGRTRRRKEGRTRRRKRENTRKKRKKGRLNFSA